MTTPKPRKAAVTAAKTTDTKTGTTIPATSRTVIVAHISRQQHATALAADTGAYISLDNGRLGCRGNHLKAWQYQADNNTADWGLVIEDDALPIDGFADQVAAALSSARTPIVSLYLGQQRPPQHQPGISAAVTNAQTNDHAWIHADRAYHAVAIAIRTTLIPEFLRVARLGHNSSLDIDETLTEYLRYYGHQIAYTQPSLVDHRDEMTIAKHRDAAPRPAGRKAWRVGARETWETDVTVIP